MRLLAILGIGFSLVSCHHASLMLEDPDNRTQEAGQALLSSLRSQIPLCEGVFEVQGKDVWNSRILRWLTPLSRKSSTFKATRTGEVFDLVIDQKTSFNLADEKLSGLDRIYVESLRLYILLPQLLAEAQNPVLLGEQSFGGNQYTSFFFTLEPGYWNDPKLDQYVAYFHNQTRKLDLIQFTYRDLLKTYVGWLKFGPEKAFAGFKYPATIRILDNWDAKQSTHEIHLSSVQCSPSH